LAARDVGLAFRRSEILLLPTGATLKIKPSKLGLLWCCGRFPSAPLARLANKSRKCFADKRLVTLFLYRLAKFFQRLPESWRGFGQTDGIELV